MVTPPMALLARAAWRIWDSTAVLALVWAAAAVSSFAIFSQQHQLQQARLASCGGRSSADPAVASAATAAKVVEAAGERSFLGTAQQTLVEAAEKIAASEIEKHGRLMASALDAMQRRAGPQDMQVAVAILKKIGDNIRAHPDEQRYRAIRKTNARFAESLGKLPGHEVAMRALGFSDEPDGAVWAFQDVPNAVAGLEEAISVLHAFSR
mmetsp:Transcript_105458/g.305029  ORF Transcript_105458/g.305029 Transcript_105458/m.305029 type:complete len:209 (-) Transcript_105458:125-751(-)|eukprot:CAMPEP_0176072660 /NCGR_PEP_ID=MMETSP0120_2-20121206/36301_1 /TAXON_ID=160619 /ORGANISM="Kryptoperidinium foliaceum, Strain CCMP 1326" /LENGTH=208 /DNA_ID=CAMNT_0017406335 /DNA_START=55 /DNA_END=681 /DNA_ORIENTATION=-